MGVSQPLGPIMRNEQQQSDLKKKRGIVRLKISGRNSVSGSKEINQDINKTGPKSVTEK